MPDPIIAYLRSSLPEEVVTLSESYLEKLDSGNYEDLLRCPEAHDLLRHSVGSGQEDSSSWSDHLLQQLGILFADRSKPGQQIIYFCIGYASLLAFLQSNVTGPPLDFRPSDLVLPPAAIGEGRRRGNIQAQILAGLSIDGISAYKLTPNIELLCLAQAIMACPAVLKNVKAARWIKMRVAFVQQRLLSEVSSSLQNLIYDDLDILENDLSSESGDLKVEFLLERSAIHIHHGLDKLARADLEQAKMERHFDFALTGLLGKRTKFQENDISQLVVLARSQDTETFSASTLTGSQQDANGEMSKPTQVDLNDDTLLEAISFSSNQSMPSTDVQTSDKLSPALQALDPSNQPQLHPLDSVILLSLASSITNTSPQNGLTREETLPYATRALEGGSSNWQIYTQALLIRSRIEGYKSRTVERGLLQLQALVDQVIAETTTASTANDGIAPASTFLPRADESDSAPVTERLRYIFQLATPARWELEAELASRWVQLGGLRSALEIYERLQMWAEAALCWAATDREEKAKRIVRRQLFHVTNGGPGMSEDDAVDDDDDDDDEEDWTGPAREPPPLDAPRLYCILGDIDSSIDMYQRAWTVSHERYARAQRSIGRLCIANRDYVGAADAYSKSLKVNQLNANSWFALGCALLELGQFSKAVEAFSRCVQLDETDAEAWSNLGAALLRKESTDTTSDTGSNEPAAAAAKLDDEDDAAPEAASVNKTRQQNRLDALKAFSRAAALKHDSHRIWENVLIVAASVSPPDYAAVLTAQTRLIALRGAADGEKCIDADILAALVAHAVATTERYDPAQPGLPRLLVQLVDARVVPLITASAPLWLLVAKLAVWRNRPRSALDAEEKAWRAVTAQPGWDADNRAELWAGVVEATVRLCDAYESLGPREGTEGLAAGELVMKDWRFKARSAVRGVMGRGKASWEDTEGWERLKEVMEGLRT